MQGSKITMPDKMFAAVSQHSEINPGQQTGQTIATAQRDHNLHLRMSGRIMQLAQPIRITGCKALMFFVGAAEIMYLMPLHLQSLDGATQCLRISRIAARGNNSNMS
jgi:hypothetical protein